VFKLPVHAWQRRGSAKSDRKGSKSARLHRNRAARRIRRPNGLIREDDFLFTEASIPTPGEGQVLVRNLLLSCDPHQRVLMSRDSMIPMMPLGEVVTAVGVGQVVESRRSDYQPGELVALPVM
jgi:NADPH-dependent curcumin reductase CurA